VTAPDELASARHRGPDSRRFAAVAFVMPAVQCRAPVAASGRQVSG